MWNLLCRVKVSLIFVFVDVCSPSGRGADGAGSEAGLLQTVVPSCREGGGGGESGGGAEEGGEAHKLNLTLNLQVSSQWCLNLTSVMFTWDEALCICRWRRRRGLNVSQSPCCWSRNRDHNGSASSTWLKSQVRGHRCFGSASFTLMVESL